MAGSQARKEIAGFGLLKALQSVAGAAIIFASLFTLWTPANLFSGQIFDSMLFNIQATQEVTDILAPSQPINLRVGIVAGHWKDTQNKGAFCSDGLSEEQLNQKIATLIKEELISYGYQVDILEEFDARLSQYKALALVSIHNDTCEFISDDATGFKITPALANSFPEKTEKLYTCIVEQYKAATGMRLQTNKVTNDMTSYHTFNEVHSETPVIVIETGYMNLDRQILTEHTEQVAHGIANGILCFLGDEPIQESTPQP